jgi:hypothetical protein
MHGISGISGSVPIWRDIIMAETRFSKQAARRVPDGIVAREVCVTSGMLATASCPKTRLEKFLEGSEPSAPDTWYQKLRVDVSTGRLATSRCPRAIEKIFLAPPSEYLAWAKSAAIEAPPTRDCDGRATAYARDEAPVILSPMDGDSFEIDRRIDLSAQLVPFVAGSACAAGCEWSLDGRVIRTNTPTHLWRPEPGDHVLELAGAARPVHFRVR